MSLEAIIERILEQARAQAQEISDRAKQEAKELTLKAEQEGQKIYQGLLAQEERLIQAQKHKAIVNARLDCRKDILRAKQDLIAAVFFQLKDSLGKGKFRKERIFADKSEEVAVDAGPYLEKLKFDYQSEIAGILFG